MQCIKFNLKTILHFPMGQSVRNAIISIDGGSMTFYEGEEGRVEEEIRTDENGDNDGGDHSIGLGEEGDNILHK